MEFKFATESTEIIKPVVKSDDNKLIEVTEMVPKIEKFTISQKKQELAMLDTQIGQLEARKIVVQGQIDNAIASLGLQVSTEAIK